MTAALVLTADTGAETPAIERIVNFPSRFERKAALLRDMLIPFDQVTENPDADGTEWLNRLAIAQRGNDTLLNTWLDKGKDIARGIGNKESIGMFATLFARRMRREAGVGYSALETETTTDEDGTTYTEADLLLDVATLYVFPPTADDPSDTGGEVVDEDALKVRDIVEGLISDDALCGVFGTRGTSKTFWGLSLALKLGRELGPDGKPLRDERQFGCPVDVGSTVYSAFEQPGKVKLRATRWERKYGRADGSTPHVAIYPKCPPLWDLVASVAFYRKAIQPLLERGAPPVRLFVVDMLLASFKQGMSEDKSGDMQLILGNLRRCGRIFRCTTLVFHHSGNSNEHRARGSSAFGGNLDFEGCMARVDLTTQFFITKLREGAIKKEPSALYHLDADGVFTDGASPTPDGKPAEAPLAARAKALHGDLLAISSTEYAGIEVVKAALAAAFPSIHSKASGRHRTTLAKSARAVADFAVSRGWLVPKGARSWKIGPVTPPDVLPDEVDDDFPTDELSLGPAAVSTAAPRHENPASAPGATEPTPTPTPIPTPVPTATRQEAEAALSRLAARSSRHVATQLLQSFSPNGLGHLNPEQCAALAAVAEAT